MKKPELLVDFRFPYAHLKQLGDNLLNLIDRDTAEFATRGMTPAKRTAFIAAKDAFENFPDDITLDAIKQGKTEAKDAARDAVETQVTSMFNAAKQLFGEDSALYRSFGRKDLSRLSDGDLHRNTKVTIAAATANLAALAGEGVTAAKITALTNANKTFDDAIDAQTTAINARDISTEGRAKAANALYALIVKYTDTGKDIWYSVSEAKYNDYIIYNTPDGGPDTSTPAGSDE